MLVHSGLPCSHCGSHDALAEYENGSYCFSCHKVTYFGYTKKAIFKRSPLIEVPFNITTIKENQLPHLFLKARYFTEAHIFNYNLMQSEDSNYLILSGYNLMDRNKRDFIEVRLLNPKIDGPKYRTIGTKKLLFRGHHSYSKTAADLKLIVVEDMLSCMRVGFSRPCVALRGTSLSEETVSDFCQHSPRTTIFTWLDSDIPGQRAAKEFKDKLAWCGFGYKNIVTEKDPKMYSDTEITDILKQVGYYDI